ncbi:uncharacterized protein PGRI_027920 [Penicillium griseofulvum]|uniref:CBF1-interacting co-repressor CIR N-terminal domain-containing protein n=1 Tax=Penicillium patulum TaxID=5078 RepID=A0A135LIX3_PENPA|nr:uncharacterized protein PGRI_027920 [Penicillium griseofulvum]KXG48922.1 hypothetical protein PGRI_027920 [Penicillium griseofulvum]
MPLHLLGKKSWNVYNANNIARVRRDEAQAKAREEEDERVMQQADAERRIKILRGERPPTPPPAPSLLSSEPGVVRSDRSSSDAGGFRKRRRVAGEDDTDRDIRYAREDAAQAAAKREELILASRKADSAQAPILDEAGHINLFPATNAKTEKNREAEAEAARKKRSYEDQYTMRFSNAAGFKETIGRKPWYSSAEQNATAPGSMPEKDVWGNEDPRRKERTQARMSANDPLLAIKRGLRKHGNQAVGEGGPHQWTASMGSDWMRRTENVRRTEKVLTDIIVAVEIEVETDLTIARTIIPLIAVIVIVTMNARRLPGGCKTF